MTITIQIGNSDDKLTQREWSEFIQGVADILTAYMCNIHFSGGSAPEKQWQNYCWVFESEADPLYTKAIKRQLLDVKTKYRQDSIAWTEGETLFL